MAISVNAKVIFTSSRSIRSYNENALTFSEGRKGLVTEAYSAAKTAPDVSIFDLTDGQYTSEDLPADFTWYKIYTNFGEIVDVPETAVQPANANIVAIVEERLRKAQENKSFKDSKGRVGGSKKEKAAYRKILSVADLSGIESEGEALAIMLIKKDKVYPKIDIEAQKKWGASSGAVFLKTKLRGAFPSEPTISSPLMRRIYTGFAEYLYNYFINATEVMSFIAMLNELKSSSTLYLDFFVWHSDRQDWARSEATAYLSMYNEKLEDAEMRLNRKFDIWRTKYPSEDWVFKYKKTAEMPKMFEVDRELASEIHEAQRYYNELEKDIPDFVDEFLRANKLHSGYGKENINRQLIKSYFDGRLYGFIYAKTDSVRELFNTAYFDYQGMSESDSARLIAEKTERDNTTLARNNLALQSAKQLVAVKQPDELDIDAFFKANTGLNDFVRVWISFPVFKRGKHSSDGAWRNYNEIIGNASEEKKRFFLEHYIKNLERDVESINKRVASTKKLYAAREDNWQWAAKTEGGVPSTPKADLVINKYPPLSYIKRTGGLKINKDELEDFETTGYYLQTVFGFKEFEYGKSIADKDAREIIYHFLGAMADLGEILNMDIKQLNQLGGLSMAFASRGSGAALAHYESVAKIINLTKSRGDGSVAHEYFHYLDNIVPAMSNDDYSFKMWLSDIHKENKRGYSWNTSNIMNKRVASAMQLILEFIYYLKLPSVIQEKVGLELNADGGYTELVTIKANEHSVGLSKSYFAPTIEDTFKNFTARHPQYKYLDRLKPRDLQILGDLPKHFGLDEYVFSFTVKESKFYHSSSKMKSDYWTRPWELLARSFETYIFDKLEQAGRYNNYLVKGAYFDRSEGVYPAGKEREAMFILFDNLMNEFKTAYAIADFIPFTSERVDEFIDFKDGAEESTGEESEEENPYRAVITKLDGLISILKEITPVVENETSEQDYQPGSKNHQRGKLIGAIGTPVSIVRYGKWVKAEIASDYHEWDNKVSLTFAGESFKLPSKQVYTYTEEQKGSVDAVENTPIADLPALPAQPAPKPDFTDQQLKGARWDAIGYIGGNSVSYAESRGYQFIPCKPGEKTDGYYDLVGFVGGNKADKCKEKGVTVRKQKKEVSSITAPSILNQATDLKGNPKEVWMLTDLKEFAIAKEKQEEMSGQYLRRKELEGLLQPVALMPEQRKQWDKKIEVLQKRIADVDKYLSEYTDEDYLRLSNFMSQPQLTKEAYATRISNVITWGYYEQAIKEGRMTATDAIAIIRGAGVTVPASILDMAETSASYKKIYHTGDDTPYYVVADMGIYYKIVMADAIGAYERTKGTPEEGAYAEVVDKKELTEPFEHGGQVGDYSPSANKVLFDVVEEKPLGKPFDAKFVGASAPINKAMAAGNFTVVVKKATKLKEIQVGENVLLVGTTGSFRKFIIAFNALGLKHSDYKIVQVVNGQSAGGYAYEYEFDSKNFWQAFADGGAITSSFNSARANSALKDRVELLNEMLLDSPENTGLQERIDLLYEMIIENEKLDLNGNPKKPWMYVIKDYEQKLHGPALEEFTPEYLEPGKFYIAKGKEDRYYLFHETTGTTIPSVPGIYRVKTIKYAGQNKKVISFVPDRASKKYEGFNTVSELKKFYNKGVTDDVESERAIKEFLSDEHSLLKEVGANTHLVEKALIDGEIKKAIEHGAITYEQAYEIIDAAGLSMPLSIAESTPLEKKALHRVQWKANKEGGQKYGNQEIHVLLDEAIFNKYLKGKIATDTPQNFKAYHKQYGDLYVSFYRVNKTGDWVFGKVGDSLMDLQTLPDYYTNGWAKDVNSFEDSEAIAQGSSFDSDKGSTKVTKDKDAKPAPAAQVNEISEEEKKPVRFEAGRKLNDKEKREVLTSLHDSYKVMNRPWVLETAVGQGGRDYEKKVYIDNATDYMVKSDITGRLLRWYIFLPDGRLAHPTELYPSISMTDAKRVQSNMEYYSNLHDENYKTVVAELVKYNQVDDVMQALTGVITKGGAKFRKEYDSSDMGKKNPSVLVEWREGQDDGFSRSVPEIVIRLFHKKYMAYDEADYVKFILGEVKNRWFGGHYGYIDWEQFYNEFTPKMSKGGKLDECPCKHTGGIADGLTLKDIAEKHKMRLSTLQIQLKKGILVEREHTDKDSVATKIAMDHLFEMPDYYTRLAKMEGGKPEKMAKGAKVRVTNDASDGGYFDGPSHDNGGIKGVVKETGQPIEVEGGEVILNKRTIAMDKEVTVSGTPCEIASELNQMGGGVKIEC